MSKIEDIQIIALINYVCLYIAGKRKAQAFPAFGGGFECEEYKKWL